jgi:hypothetical protein
LADTGQAQEKWLFVSLMLAAAWQKEKWASSANFYRMRARVQQDTATT